MPTPTTYNMFRKLTRIVVLPQFIIYKQLRVAECAVVSSLSDWSRHFDSSSPLCLCTNMAEIWQIPLDERCNSVVCGESWRKFHCRRGGILECVGTLGGRAH